MIIIKIAYFFFKLALFVCQFLGAGLTVLRSSLNLCQSVQELLFPISIIIFQFLLAGFSVNGYDHILGKIQYTLKIAWGYIKQ